MGCDIHAYIDFEEHPGRDGEAPYVSCFAVDVGIGRNYTIFSLMAGVRHDPDRDGFQPLFEPKGLPENVSYNVTDAYTLVVDKDYDDEEGRTSPELAERWVAEGSSKWANERHTLITGPDWHSDSWLTADELQQVQDAYAQISMCDSSWYQYKPPADQPIPVNATAKKTDRGWLVQVGTPKPIGKNSKFAAIIAAMRELDGDKPGRSRLVFWFDN